MKESLPAEVENLRGKTQELELDVQDAKEALASHEEQLHHLQEDQLKMFITLALKHLTQHIKSLLGHKQRKVGSSIPHHTVDPLSLCCSGNRRLPRGTRSFPS